MREALKKSLFIMLLLASSETVSARSKPAPQERPDLRIALSTLLREQKLGVRFEIQRPEEITRLRRYARRFVDYLASRLNPKQEAEFMVSCLTRAQENPFCQFIVDANGKLNGKAARALVAKSDRSSSKRLDRRDIQVLRVDLKSRDFSGFDDVELDDALKVLSHTKTWNELKPMLEKANRGKSCHPTAFMTALAVKAEKFLPEKEVQTEILKTYEKAVRCGEKREDVSSKTLDTARLRAGLFHVWNGSCELAKPYFKKISDDTNSFFNTRGAFWLGKCAQREGNKLRTAVIRNQILRNNPLSYYTFLLSNESGFDIRKIPRIEDTEISFRTSKQSKLNTTIRAAELLMEIDEGDTAAKFLSHSVDEIAQTEGSFQLYYTLLMHWSGRSGEAFREMIRLFKDHPALLSRSSLEVFYPLTHAEEIWQYRKWVDPFLITALIRQESAFNMTAKSKVGALGLMQLMPYTAKHLGRVTKHELLDPDINIRLGVKYFRQLLERFGNDAELALAAYNAGPRNVDDWLKRYPTEDRILFLDLIPFNETRNYVSLIGRNYIWYRNIYEDDRDGPTEIAPRAPRDRKLASTGARAHFKSLEQRD